MGPVNESLYYDLKELYFGDGFADVESEKLEQYLKNKYKKDNLSLKYDINYSILEEILMELDKYGTFDLVEKSHRTKPWLDSKDSEEIDNDLIKDYFKDFSFDKLKEL
ncbi:type II toxin-antitoxin system antitoxin SocA domain-containing protein [Spiroplasma endosymbiont of Labia minor]|uniref:type II toxin-antitoxin system antitoxin SocA domain-containing protein n=1 Tax=Spiroplasma endosymbiont of Labia minor TaxID=3066305 RepID=UPI0030D311F3